MKSTQAWVWMNILSDITTNVTGSMPSDLKIIHAAQLALVRDHGGPCRGAAQGQLDLVPDGAVAIRAGRIATAGPTAGVLAQCGEEASTLDATGMTILPGLVECHSHPIFAIRPTHALHIPGGS